MGTGSVAIDRVITAYKLARDGSHLSSPIDDVRGLATPFVPIRRRMCHKQCRTEAFRLQAEEVAAPRAPVVRRRTKYWTPPVHENRAGAEFACQFPGCTRGYTTKSGLGSHVVLKHTEGTYREHGWDCPHCCRSFERESAMTQHLRLHDPGASPFVCPCCQGFFPGRATIRLHLAAAHKISFRMVCRTRLRPLGNLSSTGYVIMSSKSWLSPVVSPESLVRLVGCYGA